MINDTNKIIFDKAFFFKSEKITIHISKKNGRFHNGIILELASDFLIIDDKVLGAMPIYFVEIKNIEPKEELKNEGINPSTSS